MTRLHASRSRRSSRRRWAVASVIVVVGMFGGARPGRADVVFSDGFESGGFSAWSQVTVAGDGAAVVQGSVVRSGSFAARLSESANAGSKAFARKVLPSVQQELTASGDFQVVAEGASGGNVPLFRVLDPGSTRILSVYRQNGTSGLVGVTYGGQYFSTSGRLALGTWATVAVHVITAGAASTVEVSLNGSLVYQTTTASLTAAGVGAVQIGNDTAAQAFDLVVDNVSLQNATSPTPTPPTNTALPVISGTAQQGQTLNASTGSWNGTQPIGYGYQWKRCNSAGANCVPLTGATTNSYTTTSNDVGATLTVSVTASNTAGNATVTAAHTPIIQPAPTQGVVTLWHMDETSGTTMVDSVGTNHGTLHSVTTGLPGFLGSAYGFNGVAGYVSVPSSGSLNPGSSNFSFTIHIKTTSVPATPDWDLMRKGLYTTPGGEYKMEYQPTGQASCGFKGSNGYAELQAGPSVADGQWHTITCVKTASDIRVVVDGQAFTKAANIGSISNTVAAAIGARPGSEFFLGSLDEASFSIG